MLKQIKLRTPRQQNGIFIYSTCFMLITLSLFLDYVDSQIHLGVFLQLRLLLMRSLIVIITFQIVIWLIRNKGYKGVRYSASHYLMHLKLRKAFIDSNYYNKRFYFNSNVAELPKIKLEFFGNYSKARLLVENININKDIGSINISFALNDFIVDKAYLSNNENYYIFELRNSKINHQLKFNNILDLKKYSSHLDNYTLLIDDSISIPLYGTLLVGQTGSGKTYALYSLILQMLTKNILYNIYFADPKNSSLAVLGEKISQERTATDVEDIIKILHTFNSAMESRKKEIKKDLVTKLEATYADFHYEPYIFIFDEFASFQSVLQTMDKKKRDEVMKLLSQVVLQGRQLGFFMWIVMQKSDATLLPTNLRENLPVKFVLGNAEKQTYVTAFGSGIDISEKELSVGQGLFTCPSVANAPRTCHFSYLNFDILEAVNQLNP